MGWEWCGGMSARVGLWGLKWVVGGNGEGWE